MSIEIVVQYATESSNLPDTKKIKQWVKCSLNNGVKQAEITIRVVDEEEGARLNEEWRGASGPTNVLSFPYNEDIKNCDTIQGDIVLCSPVIIREAKQQNKSPEAHWAHMVIHGTLHLQGYDHLQENDANEMESLETDILKKLHFSDPYHSPG